MLNLSMIAPTQLIEVANKHSGFMMTLAHLYSNPTYKQKVMVYAKQGGTIYLDNSFFELGKSIEIAQLLDIGHEIGARVIVIPDGNFEGIDKVTDAGFVPMLVPDSFDSAKRAFEIAKDRDPWATKVGISNIHVKKHFGTNSLLGKGRNVFVLQVLKEVFGSDLEGILEFCELGILHFLGLDDHPLTELVLLSRMYNATLDSSAFVWPLLREGKPGCITQRLQKFKEPVDFDFYLHMQDEVSAIEKYLDYLNQTLYLQEVVDKPVSRKN